MDYLVRNRFEMRLGRKERDKVLAAHITEAQAEGVNVSNLVKDLLYAYFTGNGMIPRSAPVDEEKQQRLSKKLRGISFDALEKR